MARVKRGVTSHAKHKKVLKAAKGYYGRRKNTIRIAKQAVEKANQYAFRDRKRKEAHLPRPVDPAPQRGGASVRAQLQPLHRRLGQGRHHGRPQSAVGSCDHRAGGLRGDRRPGQVGARGVIRVMIDRAYVQRMARYNRWQNENLYGVADRLSDDRAPPERGAWFGSIHKTLSHILWGDRSWMGRFTDLPRPDGRHPGIGVALSGLGEFEVRARGFRPQEFSTGPTPSTTLGSPPIRPIIPARPSANGRGRAGFWSRICSITRPIIAARCIAC